MGRRRGVRPLLARVCPTDQHWRHQSCCRRPAPWFVEARLRECHDLRPGASGGGGEHDASAAPACGSQPRQTSYSLSVRSQERPDAAGPRQTRRTILVRHTASEDHARGACATMVTALRSVGQDVSDNAARLVRAAAGLDGGRSLEECPPPAVRGTGGRARAVSGGARCVRTAVQRVVDLRSRRGWQDRPDGCARRGGGGRRRARR